MIIFLSIVLAFCVLVMSRAVYSWIYITSNPLRDYLCPPETKRGIARSFRRMALLALTCIFFLLYFW